MPIVTHLHGAHSDEQSDGFPEAWFLPDARNIPAHYARVGSWYQRFRRAAHEKHGVTWERGSATFQYANQQRATTLWYHDHALGMTRVNVYAGPAGFYLIRGGPDDAVGGTLPGPAPAIGDEPGKRYYEIPLAIQDRTFNADGSLFYPDNRAFFEGLEREQLQIPFRPHHACGGRSDVAPVWNPEFFGNTIIVNGRTWPYLEVERRRYRFRLLNGCGTRFLILRLAASPTARPAVPVAPFWQIGADGGFLPAPVALNELLMAPAERVDAIVDFSQFPEGTELFLVNVAPDEPFGGGEPDDDFDSADPQATGQVMKFVVVAAASADSSTPPDQLTLPARTPLPAASVTRPLSLNEDESRIVKIVQLDNGNIVLACRNPEAVPFGPTRARLGTTAGDGGMPMGMPMMWEDRVTENPDEGATEVWEIFNFTEDAHPIHLHQVQFEIVNRQNIMTDEVRGPEPGETGTKDAVVAFPEEITRVKARFDLPGLYVWLCHIVEHEDNEMMRPYVVGRHRSLVLGQPHG